MKYIDKTVGMPAFFATWLGSHGTTLMSSSMNAQDIWEDFRDNHKTIYQQLKTHLLMEQGNICAYCNQKISNDGNTQIEHLKDKSMFANQIFDYNNLVACCLGGEKDPKPRDLYCGAQKNRYYQQNGYSPLATYPLLASCETDIICQLNGQLKASNANIQQCIDKVVGLNVAQFTDPITGWRIHAISAVMYSNYIIYKLSLLQAKFKPTLPPKLIPITKTEAAQRYTIYNSTAKPYIPFCKAIADVLKKEFKL